MVNYLPIDLKGNQINASAFNTASTTLATTPTVGSSEFDGKAFYVTPSTSNRAVVDSEYLITNTATVTLVSQTGVQPIFTTPTNGTLTLPANGTYEFEGYFSLSSMSGSSGSFGFALGGTATLTSITWMSQAAKATLATAAAWTGTFNVTNANTALTAANTNTVGAAYIRGTFTMTTAGTVIPQVSQGNAAAAVVGVGSFFRFWPVGSNTVTSVGNWS